MNKFDIKWGDIVKVRNGDLYLVVPDGSFAILVNNKNSISLWNYNEDLKHGDRNRELDIIEVYSSKEDILSDLKSLIKDSLWKGNIRVVTRKEIAEKFNIPIEQLIIKEDEEK